MENKQISILNDAMNSIDNFIAFSLFVAKSENVFNNYGIVLTNEEDKSYDQLWFELEILNSLALSEWEEQGRSIEWNKVWELKYKSDATELIHKLLAMLKSHYVNDFLA